MALKDYSTTPANNNSAPPDGAPEGMPAASVNDTMRQIMADIKAGVYMNLTTVAEMTALTKEKLSDNTSAILGGYTTQGDGGGGAFYWDSTSADTANSGTIFASDEGGVGRWIRIHNGVLDVRWFGAKVDWDGATGTDDTLAIQAAVDFAETLIIAGGASSIWVPGISRIIDTITVSINNTKVPNITIENYLIYDGPNDRSALHIGATGSGQRVFVGAVLELGVRNNNEADWTDAACVGIEINNSNTSDINIKYARGFTDGVLFKAISQGIGYNNITLGYMANNAKGIATELVTSGWFNENDIFGGRFTVFSGTNITKTRTGVLLDGTGATGINNNNFYGPSFEMSAAEVGASLSIGIDFRNAVQNHISGCRSEDTGKIAIFDATSTNNLVEIGMTTGAVQVIEEAETTPAGNVIVEALDRHETHSKLVFSAENLKDRSGISGANTLRVSGMLSGSTSDGSMIDSQNGAINANSIQLTSGRVLGVEVDTTNAKKFTLNVGYDGTVGGRLVVLCFDAGGSLLSGSSPIYAYGTNNATLGVSGVGYWSGSDSTANRSVRFHDDVKSAFIGVSKGNTNIDINSFRLFAQDTTNGIDTPVVISTEDPTQISPTMRYASAIPTAGTWKKGDILFHTDPAAGGFIGWVCTAAGTPGTWKTWGVITV